MRKAEISLAMSWGPKEKRTNRRIMVALYYCLLQVERTPSYYEDPKKGGGADVEDWPLVGPGVVSA
jgi:hypothetical protein